VPAVLALYGVGALVGIVIGGRTADRDARRTVRLGVAAAVVVLVGLACAATVPAAALPRSRRSASRASPSIRPCRSALGLAGDAGGLAAALNVSAFNVGITSAPGSGAW
jgi:DHA1 family chloramphenicol resistance protein-like MFS transporter